MHRVAVTSEGPALVVHASGEIDAFAAPDLSAELESVRGSERAVVDLSRVSFLDSTALGVVVRITRELSDGGTRIRIVLPNGSARRIFEITALDTVLPTAETRDDALRLLAA